MSWTPRFVDSLANRRGTSLIELVVAMTVVGVGLVAMSGAMTLNMRQAGIAEFRADQAAVRQYAAERLKGLPIDSVVGGSTEISGITASWAVEDSADAKIVTLITGGALVTARLARFDADTVMLRILR